ncbi:MAG TPA: glycosyltransferase family 2 protein [Catalimonadaceae bacterium]|nr:glycosyltransferase family 2 protein [Catalimonadaceae bacterium]
MILTILTPVYQGASFLKACIENVAGQWTDGIEHLVLDGGSTDGTVGILEEMSARYPHLRWISEKDKGQSDAMNKGIAMARGSWISFLNVDDFYEPGILPKVLEIIQRKGDKPCLLMGNLNVWNEKEELISVNRPSNMTFPLMLADICEWPFNPSAYFYPVSVHKTIGNFPENEHYAMDYDFILRILMAKIPVYYHNEIWGNFRLLPEAKTGKDQAGDASYQRAAAIRSEYLAKASASVQLQTRMLKLFWAVRNKIYGILYTRKQD